MQARAKSAGAEPDLATRLDLERTHIAYEQSMMTWIRTAITLITFGFTIYKFFQLELPGRAEKSRCRAPRVCTYTGCSGSHFAGDGNAGASAQSATPQAAVV